MQINIHFKLNSFVESHKSCIKKSFNSHSNSTSNTMLLLVINSCDAITSYLSFTFQNR